MSLGSQQSSGTSSSSTTGESHGISESVSSYGADSTSKSAGKSTGESIGQSTSQGRSFGFAGLSPTDSAALSSALYGQITNNALPAISSAANAQINLPTLTERGLYPAQEAAARQAVQDSIAQMSSTASTRGQLAPENVSAVAGSAVQNVLPQLMPVISSNIQAAGRAPLDTALARAQGTAQLLQAFPGLLGSQTGSFQEAQSTQEARSYSEQLSEALSRTFGSSISKSLQNAFNEGNSSQSQNSFGFGVGII